MKVMCVAFTGGKCIEMRETTAMQDGQVWMVAFLHHQTGAIGAHMVCKLHTWYGQVWMGKSLVLSLANCTHGMHSSIIHMYGP